MSLAWLTAHPIAHRGLHDGDARIENSLGAARAAIEAGYAIECDVQLSRDGQAIVFHDATLERLTSHHGALADYDAAQLTQILLKSGEAIPTIQQLLSLIDGRVPLICEIKSAFDGDLRLARRVAQAAALYQGPLALESFDPAVMAFLRAKQSALRINHVALGIVAQAHYDRPEDEWAHLPLEERQHLAELSHLNETNPDFLSWNLRDLPHSTPHLWRNGLRRPLTIWTVRSPQDQAKALTFADQIVFEGFRPLA